MRRRLPGCEWLLLLLAVADWLALRFRALHPPSVLALLVALTGLEVEGMVDLASLDEGMRGHATLMLTVRREGVVIVTGAAASFGGARKNPQAPAEAPSPPAPLP